MQKTYYLYYQKLLYSVSLNNRSRCQQITYLDHLKSMDKLLKPFKILLYQTFNKTIKTGAVFGENRRSNLTEMNSRYTFFH